MKNSGVRLAMVLGVVTFSTAASAQGPAPPAPMGPNVAGAQTEEEARRRETLEELERARQEDSGRAANFLYVGAGAGGGYYNLSGFADDAIAISQPSGGGGVGELGAGVQLLVLTLGARARWTGTSGFNLWQLMADAAFHFPGTRLDPFVGIHVGYAFTGSVDTKTITTVPASALQGIALQGFVGGIDVGGDYYLSPLVSVGASATFDVFALARDPAKTAGGAPVPDATLARSGSAAGYGISGALRIGLHL